MRELALVGFVALASALASYYFTENFGWFGIVNGLVGSVALLVSGAAAARHLRVAATGASGRVIARGLLIVLGAAVLAVGAERLAARSGVELDWTFEGSFELSPAMLAVLEDLPGEVLATLYNDVGDPRQRRTALLLEHLAEHGPVRVRERVLSQHPEDADLFEVGSSNSVVLILGDRFETVDRPTEGTLFEALYRLSSAEGGVVTVLRGEGEGDLSRTRDTGYAGLAAALATEGYQVHSVVSARMEEVPPDTDVLLVVGPRRPLRPSALAAIERYLLGGGSLVAMLEPGVESGLEEVLARFGIESPDAVVVDPDAPVRESPVTGLSPVAHNYWDHPITAGLDRNRMTYFPRARAFRLHVVEKGDELSRVVDSSPHAWLEPDLSVLDRSAGTLDGRDATPDYQPLVVSGEFQRAGGRTRIVAFGDADLASNANLRTLYNLDLVMNAVHWAAENEPAITLRPKASLTPVQFPIPLTKTLETLQGVGLLVPELLLLVGGLVWVRRRSA
jgi:hypothetical protein